MKNIKNLTIVLFVAAFFAVSCGDSSSSKSEVSEVKIGDQIWMTNNLNVDKFQNGDPIPHVESAEAWKQAGKNGQPAWCYYDNDPANEKKYGKLYNWHAVNDPRGLAPAGWHIPSDEEWNVLINSLGDKDLAGKKMKSSSGWEDDGNGTNESGFSGLPGGNRKDSGEFYSVVKHGNWWSSTEFNKYDAWCRNLYYNYGDVTRSNYRKERGLSVRCIKD